MTTTEAPTQLGSITPFFIVASLFESVAFYRDRLGFDLVFATPDDEPFFAIVRRDGVQLMLKEIASDVPPLPNRQRHAWAKWDAFVYVEDPDRLSKELAERGVAFLTELADTEDGLRGFELQDADGYVLFCGRPPVNVIA